MLQTVQGLMRPRSRGLLAESQVGGIYGAGMGVFSRKLLAPT